MLKAIIILFVFGISNGQASESQWIEMPHCPGGAGCPSENDSSSSVGSFNLGPLITCDLCKAYLDCTKELESREYSDPDLTEQKCKMEDLCVCKEEE